MTIVKFEFEDRVRGWRLEETSFSEFNLLVGASGVGKTRILESLNRVRLAATRGAQRVPDCSWTLTVDVSGQEFTWAAKTGEASSSLADFVEDPDGYDDSDSAAEETRFIEERITAAGEDLATRNKDNFFFSGKELPRLKDSDSAIELLRREREMRPLHTAMRRFLFSRAHVPVKAFVPFDKKQLERAGEQVTSIDELRDAPGLSVLTKAALLQNKFPAEFRRVIEQYQEIFEQVEDVRIGALSEFEPNAADSPPLPMEWLTIALRERGVDGWLVQHRVSSGMLRTLFHLLELALAPAGTVVLIDEFENSLGVNCLPQVTEHILHRSGDLQFLLTSHHPYIINNVPPSEWRVVVRSGSVVKVLTDEHIPALRTGSHHDHFTILTNLPEFERGVQ
jgi:energy-coupling factor transporter ATP-binding protein EcfA2